MDLLTWLIVGLVAGVLASMVMGGTGYGIIGDIIVGICGAFVGGWLLAKLGTGVPVGGLAGTIIVAFVLIALACGIYALSRRRPVTADNVNDVPAPAAVGAAA